MKLKKGNLRLGPDVVQLLLPHRPPLLMVDRVESFERGERPRLRASRFVTVNEPVFQGHFQGLAIWPGIYTIEGMGQSGHLLNMLDAICTTSEAQEGSAEVAFDALRNLDRGFALDRSYDPESAKRFLETLRSEGRWVGLSTAVDVRFKRPVYAGSRIDYDVTRTHLVDSISKFEVEALVDGAQVARGSMSGSWIDVAPPPTR